MLEFQRESNQKPPAYTSNVRFELAKSKIEELFLKFLSQPSTYNLVQQLTQDIKDNNLNIQNIPHPLFTNQKMPLQQSLSNSQLMGLKSPNKGPSTPPKQNKSDSKQQSDIGDNSKLDISHLSSFSCNSKQDPSLTQQQQQIQNNSDLQQPQLKQKESITQQKLPSIIKNESMHYSTIPQFYYPEGQPEVTEKKKEALKQIDQIFQDKKDGIDVNEFHEILKKVLELPEFLSKIGFEKIDKNQTGKITKQQFLVYYKQYYENETPKRRCFNLFKQDSNNYIVPDDFKQLMLTLLETHPGLEFLKSTPEFQERYAETVILRIFFMVNRKDDGQITWREFNISNFFEALYQVNNEEDINKVRNFFSYEHFYVLYCKFWELDQDHDFLITKEDFSRYQGHGLSRKTVDRIFDDQPRKFRGADGKMSYEDFIYFVLAEEDKTTIPSIEYWFKVIDLDNNGIITGYEMEYFYEEQRQRLEYLNHEIVYFEDVVCQMVDLLKPEDDIKFYMRHFKEQQSQCGVFFNMLTNLNKFVQYEQRDPFVIKHELTEHPDYTDWDRFAMVEYQRLAMEEENNENPEIDVMDPWDGENNEMDTGNNNTNASTDDTDYM